MIHQSKTRIRGCLWLAMLCAAFMMVLAFTAPRAAIAQQAADAIVANADGGKVTLKVNNTTVVKTVRPYKRVSVGQPEIADFNAIAPTSILLTAKKPGTTQLIIWDEQERSQILDVNVTMDLDALKDQYKLAFPNAKIDVAYSGGTILLRGQVADLDAADHAVQIATPYAGKVVNMLEVAGGQQVMLQVRFAEISRSATHALGINGAYVDGAFIGASNIAGLNPLNTFSPGNVGDNPATAGRALREQGINPSVTLFGAGQIGSFYLQNFIEALRQNNLLRILAEPNLTAISGQEATFLAGGEFPIPVSQGGNTSGGGAAITIEFREFGAKLRFVPLVLGDGRIRLKVAPEVSDLDFTTAVRFGGFVVPGLSQRKVTTTVELADGQSFAIAGLLNNNVTATKDVVPVLGDLPIVGPLFRSVRYQRKETELVVIVTPHLVAPLNPSQVPLLPGEKWHHPTEAELFWRQDIGHPENANTDPKAKTPPRSAPLFYGQYGFSAVGPASASTDENYTD
ncbi:MAG TPA: type II and III secretion system protein family protein [Tepidisphaeraceae bacterium]|nr:type II and III secretion system protein family protein [Tepidisphaeraceae bacterium]